jgi:hypothetical protein
MAKDGYEAFLAEVLAAVPEDKRAAIEGTLKDEALAPKIRERVLARSEFSRNMDSLKAERTQFEREVAEARTRIKGWNDWYGSTTSEFAKLQSAVRKYQETYGELDGDKAASVVKGMSQDEINALLTQQFNTRDQAALKVADVMTDIKLDYRERFKERLNMDELITFAGERNLPLDAAYDAYIRPKVEEQREADLQKRLEAAKEEGKREAMSSARFPNMSRPSEPHPLDNADKAPKTHTDRVAAAVADWNSASEHSIF